MESMKRKLIVVSYLIKGIIIHSRHISFLSRHTFSLKLTGSKSRESTRRSISRLADSLFNFLISFLFALRIAFPVYVCGSRI